MAKEVSDWIQHMIWGNLWTLQKFACNNWAQHCMASEKSPLFKQASSTMGMAGSLFKYDRDGFLVRTLTIDEAVQIIVTCPLGTHFPCLFDELRPVQHIGVRLMFSSWRGEHYWPTMADDVYIPLMNATNAPKTSMPRKEDALQTIQS